MAIKDGFTAYSSNPEWYEGLKRSGSCLQLYELLQINRELIHELGPDGITVLHKGVEHGCVKLVKFVLDDMFDKAGNCNCKGEGNGHCGLTREGLLRKTCKYGSTAANMALVSGSPKMVLLLEWATRVSCVVEKKLCDEADNAGMEYHYSVESSAVSSYLQDIAGSQENEAMGNIVDAVPDVKDEVICESIPDSDMHSKVYEIISATLKKNFGEDEKLIIYLKERCKKSVDFDFVPTEHIFLHYLLSVDPSWYQTQSDMFKSLQREILQDIIVECKKWDDENGGGVRMVETLFKILDPRGRTILHVVYQSYAREHLFDMILKIFEQTSSASERLLSPSTIRSCLNAKDGAGRTLFHMVCIFNKVVRLNLLRELDVDVALSPLCNEEFKALRKWCFGDEDAEFVAAGTVFPIHLAVIFNSREALKNAILARKEDDFNIDLSKPIVLANDTPFQIASTLGRVETVEMFLEHQKTFRNIKDKGFGEQRGHDPDRIPALHCAAIAGQVEVIQSILKYPIYDPMCQTESYGTALHALLKMQHDDGKIDLKRFKVLALHHVLPISSYFKRIENDFLKLDVIKSPPRDFMNDERICINLLLHSGIDVWTPHVKKGQWPNVESNADNEARRWWYDKVVKEVETKKASITSAANATSVIGALVATTSFIGPLQPPLSYSSDGGFIDTSRISMRVYLVCNSISFFFSIASILMAVLPAIPMPKESVYDEMIRSERCLKAAVSMLLISIICILVSFSSASIAVVPPYWHDRKLIVISMAIGGGICIFVLVIYIIRLLRMVYYKNRWLRRRFAEHMVF